MDSHPQGQRSEVARLLAQIREEYESAKLGVSGLAQGVGQHKFITQKMERMGQLQGELETIVGDEAIALVVAHLETCPDAPSSSLQ